MDWKAGCKRKKLCKAVAALTATCIIFGMQITGLATGIPLILPQNGEVPQNIDTGLPFTLPEGAFEEQGSTRNPVKQGAVLCDTKLFALPEAEAGVIQDVAIGQVLDVYATNVNGRFNAVMADSGAMAYIAAGELSLTAPTRDDRPEIHLTDGGTNGYPGELYNDETYLALIAEAKEYIGMPYVWGGSTPETSFDCSGYVCWVLNNSGVFSLERTNAQGLFDLCAPVGQQDARPGDLIFFEGTHDANWPVTHVAFYVGNGYMLHCGKPIGYSRIDTPYWQEHFYAFGRLPG